MKFYSVMHKIFAAFFRFIFRVTVVGAENEPENGGYAVCANHISNADVIILAASLKRPVRFFAKAELFRIPILKQLITALGAFPVDRGHGDVGAVKRAVSLISGGETVGIYPQGTRYPGVHPSKTAVKSGVSLICRRTECGVLPVSIVTENYRIALFRKTTVTVGRFISKEELNIKDNSIAEYDRAAKYVFNKILSLTGKEQNEN